MLIMSGVDFAFSDCWRFTVMITMDLSQFYKSFAYYNIYSVTAFVCVYGLSEKCFLKFKIYSDDYYGFITVL